MRSDKDDISALAQALCARNIEQAQSIVAHSTCAIDETGYDIYFKDISETEVPASLLSWFLDQFICSSKLLTGRQSEDTVKELEDRVQISLQAIEFLLKNGAVLPPAENLYDYGIRYTWWNISFEKYYNKSPQSTLQFIDLVMAYGAPAPSLSVKNLFEIDSTNNLLELLVRGSCLDANEIIDIHYWFSEKSVLVQCWYGSSFNEMIVKLLITLQVGVSNLYTPRFHDEEFISFDQLIKDVKKIIDDRIFLFNRKPGLLNFLKKRLEYLLANPGTTLTGEQKANLHWIADHCEMKITSLAGLAVKEGISSPLASGEQDVKELAKGISKLAC